MTGTTARTQTFVFTDIEGSSALWERLGNRFMAAVETHNLLIDEACQRHGGSIVKEEGDAFFLDVYGGFQTYGLDYFTGTDPIRCDAKGAVVDGVSVQCSGVQSWGGSRGFSRH